MVDLVKILDAANLTIDRFYCIEIDRFIENTGASASQGSWSTKAKIYDLQKRTMSQIAEEIIAIAEQSFGRWRITIYYWSGQMRSPSKTRIMGIGEDFLYDYKSRGDLVLKLEPSIEFFVHNGEDDNDKSRY